MYYEARLSVGGKRKTLGQRKTAEEAYALILKDRGETPQRSVDRPRRRTLQVRAA